MKKLNKRGYEISTLAGIAIVFVVLAIVLSFGARILDDIQDDQTSGNVDYNATDNGLASIEEFSSWLPTLALIVVAAVIIGIIVRYFAFR
jgi:Na+/proline symporter|tara:strand:- start:524 stop:793 length:270 start_codon:yes stop_codon:yes gene_type:complete